MNNERYLANSQAAQDWWDDGYGDGYEMVEPEQKDNSAYLAGYAAGKSDRLRDSSASRLSAKAINLGDRPLAAPVSAEFQQPF